MESGFAQQRGSLLVIEITGELLNGIRWRRPVDPSEVAALSLHSHPEPLDQVFEQKHIRSFD